MKESSHPGSLYLVATPIGHLADISLRALEILKQVDLIAAEDTRHSQHLLQHHQIPTPTLSLHEHNETQRTHELIKRLQEGKNIALISDAGTPLISDPGYRLVSAAHEHHIKVIPIPGACAAIAALSASGIATDQFIFIGFLPSRGEARHKQIISLSQEPRSVVFYESTHRIVNLIDLLHEMMGSARKVCIARELTKTFETIHTDTLENVKEWLHKDPMQRKGEFVVIVEGLTEKPKDELIEECRRILKILLEELPLKQAVALTVKLTACGRKIVYPLALEMINQ